MPSRRLWILAWTMLACSALFYAGVQFWVRPIPDPDPQQVARLTAGVLEGSSFRTDWLPPATGDVYVRLRPGGQAWGSGGTWGENLQKAVETARAEGGPPPVSVAVALATGYQPVTLRTAELQQLQARVGIDGLELQTPSDPPLVRFSPLEMIVLGQTFTSQLRSLTADGGYLAATLFRTHQVLVTFEPVLGRPLQRGHAFLPERLTEADYREFRALANDWLVAHVDARGELPYLYLPTSDRAEEQGLLPVRLWLGTWALARLAKEGQPGVRAAYRRNLAATLGLFYRAGHLVHEDGAEHLGDYACAALALLEGPEERPALLAELVAVTERMQKADGSLATYPHKPEKTGNEQFYPGEALLLWATLYARQPTPARLARLQRAFSFYRTFFRQAKVHAFVPWHSQAWTRLYAVTRDPELRAFVFEMNDWLAAEVRTQGEPDQIGAFGPQQPHASSTAVYVEALTCAWQLAREAGDRNREEVYARALRLGLHNLWQHQYRLPEDLYLAAVPAHARGALRSNVWRTPVRIDNVAHTVLACFGLEKAGFVP